MTIEIDRKDRSDGCLSTGIWNMKHGLQAFITLLTPQLQAALTVTISKEKRY